MITRELRAGPAVSGSNKSDGIFRHVPRMRTVDPFGNGLALSIFPSPRRIAKPLRNRQAHQWCEDNPDHPISFRSAAPRRR